MSNSNQDNVSPKPFFHQGRLLVEDKTDGNFWELNPDMERARKWDRAAVFGLTKIGARIRFREMARKFGGSKPC